MKRTTAAFALALLLAGCATYRLIEPGRTAVGDLYTVEPQISWSSTRTGKIELWTVDGHGLQALRFVNGIADGEGLFGGKRKDDKKMPTFRKNMTIPEIMEFVVDSVALQGADRVESAALRPYKFGNAQGFRFELSYVSSKGLEGQGTVVGTVAQGRLYLIVYSGTRVYYYPKYKDHVERIIESIRMR